MVSLKQVLVVFIMSLGATALAADPVSPWVPMSVDMSKKDAVVVAKGGCVEIGQLRICGRKDRGPTQVTRGVR